MIIALNNKSNLLKEDYEKYLEDLSTVNTDHEMILCPSFINIPLTNIDNVLLGSQNVSATGIGAYTGEVTASQLKSYGVKYSIIGHSERRTLQKESLEDVFNKIKQCFENDIIPILCVGETKEERTSHRVEEVLEQILNKIWNYQTLHFHPLRNTVHYHLQIEKCVSCPFGY